MTDVHTVCDLIPRVEATWLRLGDDYVADAQGRGDQERLRHMTATVFWQYTALGFLTLIVAMPSVPVLPMLFGIREDRTTTGQIIFALIGLRAAQGLPLGLFAGILGGYQQ